MPKGLINSALHHLGEKGKGRGHVELKGLFNQHGHGHHNKMFDSESAESSDSAESSQSNESSESSESFDFVASFKPRQVEQLVEIFYELLFRGKNWTSVFADIETLDELCNGKETYYNFDVLPLHIRFGILRRVAQIVPVNFTAPTNWENLPTQVKSLLTNTTSQGVSGMFYMPFDLNACMSKITLEQILCENLKSFVQDQLEMKLNFVVQRVVDIKVNKKGGNNKKVLSGFVME